MFTPKPFLIIGIIEWEVFNLFSLLERSSAINRNVEQIYFVNLYMNHTRYRFSDTRRRFYWIRNNIRIHRHSQMNWMNVEVSLDNRMNGATRVNQTGSRSISHYTSLWRTQILSDQNSTTTVYCHQRSRTKTDIQLTQKHYIDGVLILIVTDRGNCFHK